MKKLLISGGNGRFATYLKKYNEDYEILTPTADQMNVTNFNSVDDFISSNEPDVFIHSAALTKPLVIHEKQPSKSIRVNIIGTSNVVLACMKHNVKLVYISTDYVYNGTEGEYNEESPLKPFNKYGWSKLGGECAVKLYDNSLILRIAMMNKPFPYQKALVDVKRSLIYDEDAAKVCLDLIDEVGVINVGGDGKTIYDFVSETNSNVDKISIEDIKDVNMPRNNTLDTTLFKGKFEK